MIRLATAILYILFSGSPGPYTVERWKHDVWIKTGDGDSSTEKQLVGRTDMEWRTVDAFGVDAIYFESFHGGSDKTWAPTRECSAEFGAISVRE